MTKSKKSISDKLPLSGVLVVPPQMSKEEWLFFVQIKAISNLKNLLMALASDIDGAKVFPAGLWDGCHIKAGFIFREAEIAGIKLPSVPDGSDTIKSFEHLQNWVKKSLCKISQPQRTIQNIMNGKNNAKMGLREFLEKCTDVEHIVIDSKIKRIKAVDKTKKLLPKTANKPKSNETKLYYESTLISVWPKLKDAIPTLPNLKK